MYAWEFQKALFDFQENLRKNLNDFYKILYFSVHSSLLFLNFYQHDFIFNWIRVWNLATTTFPQPFYILTNILQLTNEPWKNCSA